MAWLFGIARNVVAGERRRKAKELSLARVSSRPETRHFVDGRTLPFLTPKLLPLEAVR